MGPASTSPPLARDTPSSVPVTGCGTGPPCCSEKPPLACSAQTRFPPVAGTRRRLHEGNAQEAPEAQRSYRCGSATHSTGDGACGDQRAEDSDRHASQWPQWLPAQRSRSSRVSPRVSRVCRPAASGWASRGCRSGSRRPGERRSFCGPRRGHTQHPSHKGSPGAPLRLHSRDLAPTGQPASRPPSRGDVGWTRPYPELVVEPGSPPPPCWP